MDTNRMTPKIVGALFLTAMAASLLGGGMVEGALASTDPLKAAAENAGLITAGTLLELLNAIAVIGIGVLLFPYLRGHSLNMALGYLALRVVEAVFCSIIVISPLSLIALSQEYTSAGTAQAAALSSAGAFSIAARASVAGLLIPVFFSLGALIFYALAYQTWSLPRPLAAWGLIGAVLILTNTLLVTFNVELSMGVQMIFALPMILNEIFLGIWLMVKGFNTQTTSMGLAWQTSTL